MDRVLRNSEFQNKLSELLAQDWFKIGTSLNIKQHILVDIRDDFMLYRKQENKARQMIQEWFKIDKNPAFKILKDAILNIPRQDLLKEVEDLAKLYYGKLPTIPPVLSNGAPNPENHNQVQLTSKIVGRVGFYIGDKFDLFGYHLGLSHNAVRIIRSDEKTTPAMAVAVISTWMESNNISKWEELKEQLLSFGLKKTVEIIEDELNNP